MCRNLQPKLKGAKEVDATFCEKFVNTLSSQSFVLMCSQLLQVNFEQIVVSSAVNSLFAIFVSIY